MILLEATARVITGNKGRQAANVIDVRARIQVRVTGIEVCGCGHRIGCPDREDLLAAIVFRAVIAIPPRVLQRDAIRVAITAHRIDPIADAATPAAKIKRHGAAFYAVRDLMIRDLWQQNLVTGNAIDRVTFRAGFSDVCRRLDRAFNATLLRTGARSWRGCIDDGGRSLDQRVRARIDVETRTDRGITRQEIDRIAFLLLVSCRRLA